MMMKTFIILSLIAVLVIGAVTGYNVFAGGKDGGCCGKCGEPGVTCTMGK